MAKKQIDAKTSERITLFKILADANRYRAAAYLIRAKGGASVGAIAEELGMSHSSVSHLLSGLYNAGIVIYKKSGREVVYTIAKTPQAKRVARLARSF